MRPRLVLLATGGTISMRPTPGGNIPSLDGAALLALAPHARGVADVTVEDWGRVPASHLDSARLMALRARVLAVQQGGADGLVVTHGTDTIEETAYLLARSVPPDPPVVVTGAMRTSADPDWDGGRNLTDAIRVAAAREARGRGVMVAFHGRVLAGEEAVKLATLDLDAFGTPHGRPLGEVTAAGTLRFAQPRAAATAYAGLAAGAMLPPVAVVALVPGDDGMQLDVLRERCAGAVLLGFGAGNLSEAVLTAARRWLAAGKPVVLASRAPHGEVAPLYGFPGGSRQALEAGLIPAGPRTPWQARVELQLALAAGRAYGGGSP